MESSSRAFDYVRDQYNIQNVASQRTVLDTLRPIDLSGYYVPPCMRGTRQ